MSFGKILRFDFHPQTKGHLRQVILHPLICGCRLLRFLNQDDVKKQRLSLRNLAMGLPDRVAGVYLREIENLGTFPLDDDSVFPYPYLDKEPIVVESGFDRKRLLPYVVHKGRSFFGTKDQRAEEVARSYRYYVEDEGLLGTGRRVKSPHAYVDEDFKVEEGDVVVDVGCSDALFAFDNAEVAGKIYLFESWKKWRPALEASFEPFREKTHIFSRLVSDKTNKREIRLSDAIREPDTSHFFIKMDIEGGERAVLATSADFLRRHKVKLSCCVYHRQDDAEVISGMLKELGFSLRYSDGYMLPSLGDIVFPYFRHGVVHARNF